MEFFRLVALLAAIATLSLSSCSSSKTTVDAIPIKSVPAPPTPSPIPSSTPSSIPKPKTLEEAAAALARLDSNAANYLSYLGYVKRLNRRCEGSPAELVKQTHVIVQVLSDKKPQVSHLEVISSADKASKSESYSHDAKHCAIAFVDAAEALYLHK